MIGYDNIGQRFNKILSNCGGNVEAAFSTVDDEIGKQKNTDGMLYDPINDSYPMIILSLLVIKKVPIVDFSKFLRCIKDKKKNYHRLFDADAADVAEVKQNNSNKKCSLWAKMKATFYDVTDDGHLMLKNGGIPYLLEVIRGIEPHDLMSFYESKFYYRLAEIITNNTESLNSDVGEVLKVSLSNPALAISREGFHGDFFKSLMTTVGNNFYDYSSNREGRIVKVLSFLEENIPNFRDRLMSKIVNQQDVAHFSLASHLYLDFLGADNFVRSLSEAANKQFTTDYDSTKNEEKYAAKSFLNGLTSNITACFQGESINGIDYSKHVIHDGGRPAIDNMVTIRLLERELINGSTPNINPSDAKFFLGIFSDQITNDIDKHYTSLDFELVKSKLERIILNSNENMGYHKSKSLKI